MSLKVPLQITARGGRLSHRAKLAIAARLNHSVRHFPKVRRITALVDLRPTLRKRITVQLHARRYPTMVVSQVSEDLWSAVDDVAAKLHRMLRKRKEKLIDRHRYSRRHAVAADHWPIEADQDVEYQWPGSPGRMAPVVDSHDSNQGDWTMQGDPGRIRALFEQSLDELQCVVAGIHSDYLNACGALYREQLRRTGALAEQIEVSDAEGVALPADVSDQQRLRECFQDTLHSAQLAAQLVQQAYFIVCGAIHSRDRQIEELSGNGPRNSENRDGIAPPLDRADATSVAGMSDRLL